MIDFHTHILPGMDDGSQHVSESLKLLKMEKRQGIDRVILTPHFYAGRDDPESFLRRREYCWGRLRSEMEEGLPKLHLGAEVQFFSGMEFVDALPSLCIQGTNLLLLEMPFCRWSDNALRSVMTMNDSGRVRIVLAHIDRYLADQPAKTWQTLRENGVLMQVNADFFTGFFRRRKALSMVEQGMIDVIGSDCHNLDTRKPDWEPVPDDVRKKLERNARNIITASRR